VKNSGPGAEFTVPKLLQRLPPFRPAGSSGPIPGRRAPGMDGKISCSSPSFTNRLGPGGVQQLVQILRPGSGAVFPFGPCNAREGARFFRACTSTVYWERQPCVSFWSDSMRVPRTRRRPRPLFTESPDSRTCTDFTPSPACRILTRASAMGGRAQISARRENSGPPAGKAPVVRSRVGRTPQMKRRSACLIFQKRRLEERAQPRTIADVGNAVGRKSRRCR